MGTARQEAVFIGRVSDHDRRAVRCRVTVLTSDRLDLVGSDVLRLPRLRYGDTVFRVIAATMHIIQISREYIFMKKKKKKIGKEYSIK